MPSRRNALKTLLAAIAVLATPACAAPATEVEVYLDPN